LHLVGYFYMSMIQFCAFIVCVCFRSSARAPECDSLSIGKYYRSLLPFCCQLYQFNRLVKCFTVLPLLQRQ